MKTSVNLCLTFLSLFFIQLSYGQVKTISGTVLDHQNVPLPGVNITVKEGNQGTTSDFDGNYTIAAEIGQTLVFSSVGFQDQEVRVTENLDQLDLQMKEGTLLDEVIVIGYGTEKKENLTGAVGAVSGEEMNRRPVVNAATMLSGQVPGLQVNQGTGQPGADSPSIRIRGQGTFSGAGNDPLVLIDGVEGSLSLLNPNDIESVSVLKDAASASIYGSKAANGVILVTTKEGKEGTFSIDYSGTFSQYSPTKMLNLVTNSAEYMRLFNEAKENSGIASSTTTYTDEMIALYENASDRIAYPNFDWLDYMFENAFVQRHDLAVSGGANGTTYRLSLGYVDQPGTMQGFNFEKFNMRANLKSEVKEWATIGFNAGFEKGNTKQPRQGQQDAFLSTLSQPPTYAPFLPDGRPTDKAYNFEANNKNMAVINAHDVALTKRDFNISAQLWSDLTLFEGMQWYTKFAVRYAHNYDKDWRPANVEQFNFHTGEFSRFLDVGPVGLTVNDGHTLYSNLYSYLKYDFPVFPEDHNVAIQVGYSQEENEYKYLSGGRQTFVSNELHELDAGSSAIQTNSGTSNAWAIQSFFGRLNYSFQEKYLLEVNLRTDGSSRFASGNRWGWFPSFSAGWRFSQEEFVQNSSGLHWISEGKIRGSYGILGNQNIGIYPYQSVLSFTGDYSFDNNLLPGVAQTALSNNSIRWEKTAVTDIGLDLGLFRNTLTITYDWYRKQTSDILRGAQLTTIVGLSAPTINDGEMVNTGHEINVQYRNTLGSGALEGLQYNAGVYFDIFKNKLTKFGAREISGNTIKQNGKPYDSYYVLVMDGIFQTQDEIDSSPKQFSDNTQPGDIKFKDMNGDGVVDEEDRVIVPGRFPKFNYAFNANLSFKGFDLAVLFQGTEGQKYFVNGWGFDHFRQGTPPTKDFAKNRWTGPGTSNTEPRVTFDFSGNSQNRRASTYYLKDASYLRLKNLTFGYTFPREMISRIGLTNARVFVSGDNLVTWTPYKGLDPERAGDGLFAQYPQNKILSVGVNIGL